MKKRILSLMLVLALCLGLCVPAMASEGIPIVPPDTSGDGTENDPKIITNASELEAAVTKINSLQADESYYIEITPEDETTKFNLPDAITIPADTTVGITLAKGHLVFTDGDPNSVNFYTNTVDTGIVNDGTMKYTAWEGSNAIIKIVNNGNATFDGDPMVHTVENMGEIMLVGELRTNNFTTKTKDSVVTFGGSAYLYTSDLTVSNQATLEIDRGSISNYIEVSDKSKLTLGDFAHYEMDDIDGTCIKLAGESTMIVDTVPSTTLMNTSPFGWDIDETSTFEAREGSFSSLSVTDVAEGSSITVKKGSNGIKYCSVNKVDEDATAPDLVITPGRVSQNFMDVQISTSAEGGQVHVDWYEDIYLDYSSPTIASTTQHLRNGETIYAVAVKDGCPIAKAEFTAHFLPWPEIEPNEGSEGFTGNVEVTMSLPDDVPETAEIYYMLLDADEFDRKLDGAVSTMTSPLDAFDLDQATKYTAPITLTKSTYVLAQVVNKSVDPVETGEVFYRRYTITPGTPVNPNPGGNTSSSSDDDDDNTTTSITTNPNGSTTTTVTDHSTGTVTETTRDKDGTRTVKATQKDGTVTTTKTQPDGTVSKITETGGAYKAEITLKAPAENAPVTLPVYVPAGGTVTVSGQGEDARVVIPVSGLTAGTVAVVDGKVVPTALTTNAGLSLPLPDGATVEIRENTKTFSDVAGNFWGRDAVTFVSSRELFNGTGGGGFSPNATMTRQMLMTVLARLDGADTTGGAYEKGMAWAVTAGISDGKNPEGSISREQLAVMLYRYANTLGLETSAAGDLTRFSDSGSTSPWAQDAMGWAVGTGLIGGKGGGIVDPAGTATRAEVATILQRMVTLMAK